MYIAGIVAEFDPFHNGHKFLAESVKKNGADAVIAVMSGSFTQRGSIAVTDKWTRAAAAVMGGADLVIELPAAYSMTTAQRFAQKAVGLLEATGAVDVLAFGSVCADAGALKGDAEVWEAGEGSGVIRRYLDSGMTYRAAYSRAFSEAAGESVPSAPNDILASEYIRALNMSGSGIDIMPVRRKGAPHDAETISGNIASASEIRKRLRGGHDVSGLMPGGAFPVYDPSALDIALIGRIREMDAEELRGINDVGEGIENRFMRAAAEVSDAVSLCEAVKTKRYTMSRIRRIAWSALIGLTGAVSSLPPSYIRVLAMNETGMRILKGMKKTASLPVVTKPADYANAACDAVFGLNIRAEDWFSLAAPLPHLRRGGRDIATSPVTVR